MTKIVDYLNSVDADASLKKAHDANPEAAMSDYGLTEEQSQAVLSGDSKKIAEVDGVDQQQLSSIQVLHTTHTSY